MINLENGKLNKSGFDFLMQVYGYMNSLWEERLGCLQEVYNYLQASSKA